MRLNFATVLFLTLLFGFVASPAFSEESDIPPEPQIVVTLGEGRVSVQSEGLELTEETLQLLQTELLVDDKLSAVVMSESTTRLKLTGLAIQNLKNSTAEFSKQMADKIQQLVTKELGPENLQAPPAAAPEVTSDMDPQLEREMALFGRSLEYFGNWLKSSVFFWWGNLGTLLLMGLLGWIWSWLAVYFMQKYLPGFLASAQTQWANRKFGAFVWGMLLALGWVPAFVILAITVIGILFIPAMVTFFFVWLAVAYALLILFIGDGLGFTRAWPLGLKLLLAQCLWLAVGFVPTGGSVIRVVLIFMSMGVVIFALGPRLSGRTA